MKKQILLLCLGGWLGSGAAEVRAAAPEDPAHGELRALRTALIEAITRGNVEGVLGHLHTNVVVTWQNHEVCRGQRGVKEFFERTGKHTFTAYKVPPTPDELTIFHGPNTGVSFGETVAEYILFGKKLEMKSRWTATLVKEDGRWLLAAYHVSMNVLDNPLFNSAKRSIYAASGLTFVGGLAVGWMIAGRRRRAAAATQ